ncbi:alpha/beta hydrolase [Variovorax sp. J22P168]|uniref:alpha/beta hydrolase n=1 Tax=Variovorax jilinensis TaxID=3053513 RepID=UPI002575EDC6|nr:alpha/beta hydrolase [Variovorax sp. J22P168]MDM0011317.1 alpha/beta hydrolase [Variovorax sp. J22P168]
MNTSKIIAAAALSLVAAAGAHAEVYDGVHALTSAASRAEVSAQASVAARGANPYADGYGQGVTTVASVRDRSAVRAEAVAAAHAPNQNVRRESFAGSVIPSQFGGARISQTRQAAL